MLNIFIAKPAAILAYGQPHAVAAGFVVGARVFGKEGFDGIPTFDADGHLVVMACGMGDVHVRGGRRGGGGLVVE